MDIIKTKTLKTIICKSLFQNHYTLSRLLLLRLIGFIYLVAYVIILNQFKPLFGENGLLPASQFFNRIISYYEGIFPALLKTPSLFLFISTDTFMLAVASIGLCLSLIFLSGYASGLLLLLNWGIYLSFTYAGQLFYGFGWEMMMLELGFLSIFLVPFWSFSNSHHHDPPPQIIFFFLQWFLFRVMFGAGLIKLRGDECWQTLTCLNTHFETQPIPNTLSWYFHHLPNPILKLGVIINHIAELILPFFIFFKGRLRFIGILGIILFQLNLILSGNLAFLNWLTIIIALGCCDDSIIKKITPRFILKQLKPYSYESFPKSISTSFSSLFISHPRKKILIGVTLLIFYLSITPTLNLFRSNQMMNASFEPFRIVNTYGAFGHVGKIRREIIIEGTSDKQLTEKTLWKAYEFKAKPGNPYRISPQISPYHYRLDWQIWFAAMGNYTQHPWLVHFIYKLLLHDEDALGLLKNSPFKKEAPQYIRAILYKYTFTKNIKQGTWQRKTVDYYLPPLSKDNESLKSFLTQYGWSVK